jgi:hypothetical protein
MGVVLFQTSLGSRWFVGQKKNQSLVKDTKHQETWGSGGE